MARVMLVLTDQEIRERIPYAMICETMLGAYWGTGRRRRAWVAEFTESERRACLRLRDQARKWHLVTGVPDEVEMSLSTLKLWDRLASFCASI